MQKILKLTTAINRRIQFSSEDGVLLLNALDEHDEEIPGVLIDEEKGREIINFISAHFMIKNKKKKKNGRI